MTFVPTGQHFGLMAYLALGVTGRLENAPKHLLAFLKQQKLLSDVGLRMCVAK